MTRVLVTGATGFVGRAACVHLSDAGVTVRRAVRGVRAGAPAPRGVETTVVGGIDGGTDWRDALDGVDAVLHLASRVHQLNDTAADPLAEYRRVNVEGTERLARAAAAQGVRRLVYVSSIKVNGEATVPGRPYRADDAPAPADPYGVSKREAEAAVAAVARDTGMEIVVVRPPLVYGPGVKANFLNLMRVVDRGVPLPLGRVANARSIVYLGNLVDLLGRCLSHPAAAGGTFLVADGPPLSTPALIRGVATAFGRPARLLPVPAAALRAAGALTGRSGAVARLLGSLAVDDEPTRRTLGWQPPFTAAEGLTATAHWYRQSRERLAQ